VSAGFFPRGRAQTLFALKTPKERKKILKISSKYRTDKDLPHYTPSGYDTVKAIRLVGNVRLEKSSHLELISMRYE
jgi:hypothetical protein